MTIARWAAGHQYLNRLPLDKLKVDQGIVDNHLADSGDSSSSRMTIAFGREHGAGGDPVCCDRFRQLDPLLSSVDSHWPQWHERPVSAAKPSLDQMVSAQQNRLRHRDGDGLRSLQVDSKIEP